MQIYREIDKNVTLEEFMYQSMTEFIGKNNTKVDKNREKNY